jgi:predicted amino acid-binding ACT domain protein
MIELSLNQFAENIDNAINIGILAIYATISTTLIFLIQQQRKSIKDSVEELRKLKEDLQIDVTMTGYQVFNALSDVILSHNKFLRNLTILILGILILILSWVI